MTKPGEHPGMVALRRLLREMRWDDQDGYPGLYNGHWLFVSTGISDVTPQDLNDLFDLVGIVPDEIKPLGTCSQCKHSKIGGERGYAPPCVKCKSPRMSLFEPR